MIWNKKSSDENSLPDLTPPLRPYKNSADIKEVDSEEEHIESISSSEKHDLPSFPDSPMNKGFSQSAIKEAVSDTDKIPLPPQEDKAIEDRWGKVEEADDSLNSQNSFIQSNPFLNTPIDVEEKEEPKAITQIKAESTPIKMISIPHNYPEDAPHPPVKDKPKIPKIPEIPKVTQKPVAEVKEVEEKNDDFDNLDNFRTKEKETNTDVFVKIDKFYSAKKELSSIKQNVKEIEDLLLRIRETKLKEERELATWEKNISSVKEDIKKILDSLFEKSI